MSTLKSSNDHLTLNADGTSKDIKFQADGVEKASISSAGAFTSTTIDATKLTGNLPAGMGGKVLQVVNANYSTQVSTSSATYTDSGLSASITPSDTSSKVLVIVSQNTRIQSSGAGAIRLKMYRDATEINSYINANYNNGSENQASQTTFLEFDSPNTTSSVTYKTTFSTRDSGEEASCNYDSSPSSITLMEIAG
jgi:hypothetical protein